MSVLVELIGERGEVLYAVAFANQDYESIDRWFHGLDVWAIRATVIHEVAPFSDWLVDLARAFTPKVVPLDVTPEGTFEEATTRWGMNPIYEAMPAELRAAIEEGHDEFLQLYFAQLRAEAAE